MTLNIQTLEIGRITLQLALVHVFDGAIVNVSACRGMCVLVARYHLFERGGHDLFVYRAAITANRRNSVFIEDTIANVILGHVSHSFKRELKPASLDSLSKAPHLDSLAARVNYTEHVIILVHTLAKDTLVNVGLDLDHYHVS